MRLFRLLVLSVFVAFGIWLIISEGPSGWTIAATGFFGLCLLVAILEPWLPKPHVSGKFENAARRTTNLNCVRLLFWSGQSFEEEGLKKEGSFKAVEVRYNAASQIDTEKLPTNGARWSGFDCR